MADGNRWIGTGRLVGDPEMRFMVDGKAITKFRIAVNGWKKEDVSYLSVVTFDKIAETCGENLKKGKMVYIEARVKESNYEKDGVKVFKLDFVADTVNFLSPKETND